MKKMMQVFYTNSFFGFLTKIDIDRIRLIKSRSRKNPLKVR